MTEPIRRARPGTMRTFVIAHFALVAFINLVAFADGWFRPLAQATNGLITGSLVANVLLIAVLVGGVMLWRGGLRLYDVGLIARHIPAGALATLGFWVAAQIAFGLAGLLYHGDLRLHAGWENPLGIAGQIAAHILGNALFEDVAYRGFLFPQVYLRFAALSHRPIKRFLLAMFVSQSVFALSHIPNRIYLGMAVGDLLLDLLALLFWGGVFTAIYLRTDNLFLVVGIHALGNNPLPLFETAPPLDGANASLLMYALVIGALFGVPLARAQMSRRVRVDDRRVAAET